MHGYSTIRRTYHTALQVTPYQRVLGTNMNKNISFKPNLDWIQKWKHETIKKSNQKGNKCWICYEHKVGDQLLLEIPGILRKLSTPSTGPYHVKTVYKNDTIGIPKKLYQEESITGRPRYYLKSQSSMILGANDIS
jgi:hypothetical protein